MDGTTAGNLGSILPAPQATVPTVPEVPPQPQFSQLTPVYAPGPTNTIADIPQPAVKGLEFVQAPIPTPLSSAPVDTAQPILQSEPAILSAPIEPPTSVVSQLMQPVAQPAPVSEPRVPIPDELLPASDYSIQKIENTDLEQMVGAIPVTSIASPEMESSTQSASGVNVSQYFQNASAAPEQHDIIINNIVKRGFSFGNLNFKLIRLIAIIILIVGVLSVGGYFVFNNVINTKKTQPAPTTTAQTPVISQPSFTQPSTTATDTTSSTTTAATTSSTTTDTSAATATTPVTTASSLPSTSTAPAISSPAPATTSSSSTPAVSNTGLEW